MLLNKYTCVTLFNCFYMYIYNNYLGTNLPPTLQPYIMSYRKKAKHKIA